jgi:hypothetical protein
MNDALTALNLSQRSPVLYRLALGGWFVIALLCVALFWVDLITDYFEIIVPCTEGVPGVFNDCNFAALTPAEVSVWTSWGLSLETYGVVMLSGAAFTFLVYTTLAVLLLWQQRQSWLGLTISLALIVIPFTMTAASRNFGTLHPTLGWLGNLAYIVGNGIMLLFLYLVPNGRFSPRWAYIPMLATFLLLVIWAFGRTSRQRSSRSLVALCCLAAACKSIGTCAKPTPSSGSKPNGSSSASSSLSRRSSPGCSFLAGRCPSRTVNRASLPFW